MSASAGLNKVTAVTLNSFYRNVLFIMPSLKVSVEVMKSLKRLLINRSMKPGCLLVVWMFYKTDPYLLFNFILITLMMRK